MFVRFFFRDKLKGQSRKKLQPTHCCEKAVNRGDDMFILGFHLVFFTYVDRDKSTGSHFGVNLISR